MGVFPLWILWFSKDAVHWRCYKRKTNLLDHKNEYSLTISSTSQCCRSSNLVRFPLESKSVHSSVQISHRCLSSIHYILLFRKVFLCYTLICLLLKHLVICVIIILQISQFHFSSVFKQCVSLKAPEMRKVHPLPFALLHFFKKVPAKTLSPKK